MTAPKFDALFGGPPRQPDSRLDQRHMDLASSIQVVCEEVMVRCGREAWQRSEHARNLVMAGGLSRSTASATGGCCARDHSRNIWIQPASGDAGGALGAALFVWHQLLGKPRKGSGRDTQKGSLLGPSYSNADVELFLHDMGARYHRFDDESQLLKDVATAMADGRIVGWFQAAPSSGRARWAPEASLPTLAIPRRRAR